MLGDGATNRFELVRVKDDRRPHSAQSRVVAHRVGGNQTSRSRGRRCRCRLHEGASTTLSTSSVAGGVAVGIGAKSDHLRALYL